MSLNADELYASTIRQLSIKERLHLAAMILGEIAHAPDLSNEEISPVASDPPAGGNRSSVTKQALSEDALRQARDELARFAGAVSSGDPDSANNERIDADLARSYAATHEDES